jgi:predicted O-methyltransferase YrrM
MKELEMLIEYIRGRDIHTILEIGTCKGGTLWLRSKLFPNNSTLISIDLLGCPFEHGIPLSPKVELEK